MARKPEDRLVLDSDTELTIDTDTVLEVVQETDVAKAAREEAFAQEPVTVMLHTTSDENAPPHVIFSVNGRCQPVARGVATTIKRMFVEVMARCWETKFTQPQRDLSNPEAGNAVIGRSVLTYPFEVIEDRNPRGRAWLHAIMSQPQ